MDHQFRKASIHGMHCPTTAVDDWMALARNISRRKTPEPKNATIQMCIKS